MRFRSFLAALAVSSASLVHAAAVPPPPDLAWWKKSMEGREARLAWWREARFGMFMHWGVYSHLAGVWEGEPVSVSMWRSRNEAKKEEETA